MVNQHHENVISNLDVGIRFYESIVDSNGYVPFHWHSSLELVYVMSGQLIFQYDGQAHQITAGHFVIISSGVIHDVTNTPNHSFVLQVPIKFVEPYAKNIRDLNFQLSDKFPAAYQEIIEWLIKLNQVVQSAYPGYLFDCGQIVLQIMKLLVVNFTTKSTPLARISSNLKDLIIYINDHFREALSISMLAKKFGYNPSYLSRMFKQQTGLTILEYIYQIRLSSMYDDLINTKIPVTKLFVQNGLTNYRTARSMFKKMYGKLPNKVRDNV